MLPLCVKLNQGFLEFVRLLRCIGHSVLQFFFLKYCFYQASLRFLSETEKGEGDSVPHMIMSLSHQHVSAPVQ